jgi:hypothetical protein
MSVLAVHELPEIEGTGDVESGQFTRRRTWLVVLDAPSATGGETALSATGIPAYAAQHPTLTGCFAYFKGFRADEPDDGAHWLVTVDYRTPKSGNTGTTTDPWSREDRISFGEARYELPATYDKTPTTPLAYKNAVGDPLEVTEPRINPVLIVNRYRKRTDFDPFAVYPLVNTLNNTGYTIRGGSIAAEKGLLLRFAVQDETWSDGTALYAIRFEIELESGMVLKTQRYQNKSFYQLVGGKRVRCCIETYNYTSGTPVAFTPPRYIPTPDPVFISSNGAMIANPDTANVSASDIIRQRYAAASWTPLIGV